MSPYVKSGCNSNDCPINYVPIYDATECNNACTYLNVGSGVITQSYAWGNGHVGGCGEHSGNRCLMNYDSPGGPSAGSNRLCKYDDTVGMRHYVFTMFTYEKWF